MKKITLLFTAISSFLLFSSCKQKTTAEPVAEKPNVIFIYMDDLGYGDLSSYGATVYKTKHIDQLAENGIRFTNAYASSSTCTPSRYAILTGTYPWREKNAKILPGTAPLIIGENQMTLPKLLQNNGYYTGVVGKWHLGLGEGNIDWNSHIKPSPNEVGFNYSHIMAATQDRVPTVYIENGNVVNLDLSDPISVDYAKNFEGEPTALTHPELMIMEWDHGHNNSIVNGIPRIGFMKGGKSALWSDIDMADHFLTKAQAFVKQHKDKPFFLYYALQQPHVPRTPHPRFEGLSGMGPRGDAILEADWCVGEFMKTLEQEGLLENTIIVLTSDNGPVINDGYKDDSVEKLGFHTPSGGLRGGKYSLFEAGTRVPFISYWKNHISVGESNAMISQIDLLSSIAQITGSTTRTDDSQELSDVLLGKSNLGRTELVIEATSRTAYKNGDWVMIPPHKGRAVIETVNIEIGNDKNYQLYNLKEDSAQLHNLAESMPEKLQEMKDAYSAIINN